MSQMEFVFDAEKFGLWLRKECARQGIKNGKELHRRLVKIESEIDQKTPGRWYSGKNSPRSTQIPDILAALDKTGDGKVRDRFAIFFDEQLEELRILVQQRAEVRQAYPPLSTVKAA